jgi:3-hydroxyacyl-CoA dehydrogenase
MGLIGLLNRLGEKKKKKGGHFFQNPPKMKLLQVVGELKVDG